jgi:4'-phosphopantetheinyl transferase
MVVTNPTRDSVRVWVATLDQTDLQMRRWLNAPELERLRRYQSDADRARFLLGAAMLRSAAATELGMRPQDVPVDRSCDSCNGWHGAPRVPSSPLALSVTHGGLVVALALSTSGVVGIDVERAGRRGLSNAEAWTRAEARRKAGDGPGLVAYELPAPVPGHVMSIVTEAGACVVVRPAEELLVPRLLAVP